MKVVKALVLSLTALMMVMAPAESRYEAYEPYDLTILIHNDDCFCLDCYHYEVYCEAAALFDMMYANLIYTQTAKRTTMRRTNGKLAYSYATKLITKGESSCATKSSSTRSSRSTPTV